MATVPPPPPGNHDAGGSITVSDARFADQLVHLAVQVVDDAGNVSPVTSLGSFSLLRTFTLVRGRVTFRQAPGGGDDGLSLRGVVPLPLSAFDPSSEAFTLMLSDDDGTIFSATIPAGQFLANSRGTRLLYRVRTPGLSRVALSSDRNGGLRVRPVELSAFNDPPLDESNRGCGQRLIFLRHSVILVRGGDQLEKLARRGLPRRDGRFLA